MTSKGKLTLIVSLIIYVVLVGALNWAKSDYEAKAKKAADPHAAKLAVEVRKLDPAFKHVTNEDAHDMLSFAANSGEIIALNATIIFQIINFAFLFIILKIMLWKPVLDIMDQRKKQISDKIDAAEQTFQDAEKFKEEYQSKMAEARSEMLAMKEEGIKQGQEEKNHLLNQARDEAQKIKEKGQKEIQAELDKSKAELREQVGDIACQIAGKIMVKELDDKQHQDIINNFTNQLN